MLPPHAGLPHHPGGMLSHSRKWVQGYPHAKSLIVSQIVSFPEGFIKNITMALPVCPRSNTSKLQMQDSQSEKCLRASEKIWGITLAPQCSSKKKKLKKLLFEMVLKEKKCTDKFPASENWDLVLFIPSANPQTI